MALALAFQGHSAAQANRFDVTMRDNFYIPEELHVEPGDTVVWTNRGGRVHTVTSSEGGLFDSGDLRTGRTFSQTFEREGFYRYFCTYHGSRSGTGMAGLIVVGDPRPPGDGGGPKDERPKIVVPKDYRTIQKAVDRAKPGTKIVVRPGTYREEVVVNTPRLIIKGVDRFRTVLTGGDSLKRGITIDGVDHVTVANLTVRNYEVSGVYINGAHDYKVSKVDSIKNRTYGIYAFDSYNGVFRESFSWGSGDSAFYIGQCLGCGALIDDVYAAFSYLGYSGTNATGVVIRNSVFTNNAVGIAPNTHSGEEHGPNRGTFINNNRVRTNNYTSVPAAGTSDVIGVPFGTGIWLAGVLNNTVVDNVITGNDRYGVLVSRSIEGNVLSENNEVVDNRVVASGVYELAWDGEGTDNCFSTNESQGPTGPPDLQATYSCDNRPFEGTRFEPVASDVESSLVYDPGREQAEPPEPHRPRCQRGAPGCDR